MQFNIRSFDIYRKVPKDLTQPTTTGAVISICSIMFITFLVLSEAISFLSTEFTSQMYVADQQAGSDRISVRISVNLPAMDCKFIGIDIQDDMGRHEVGHVEDVVKTPILNPELGTAGCNFKAAFSINKFVFAKICAQATSQAANMLSDSSL
ncbi:ERGIC1 [Bugula neritina]|uniref:ERGIC1 n=1 Tax=Bugula neritina TaxID=10212 RepID=A0A7J7JC53_BUGNE|nr:ERGIC1 [Bugula neritina]